MEDKIGEGAHGVVSICTSKKNQKKYAVKIMGTDEEKTSMIKKNIRLMKYLKHDNIINHRVLFLNEAKKTSYLVMEYAPYPTLKGLRVTTN
jgi:serine/threonine protein kinase